MIEPRAKKWQIPIGVDRVVTITREVAKSSPAAHRPQYFIKWRIFRHRVGRGYSSGVQLQCNDQNIQTLVDMKRWIMRYHPEMLEKPDKNPPSSGHGITPIRW